MPEHTCAKGATSNSTLRVAPSAAAEPICDTRPKVDPCCQISQGCGLQQSSTPCSTAGNCTPDTRGGCQGSTPGLPSSCCRPTCPDLAQEPCCQNDSDAHKPSCEDGHCPGPGPSCAQALDSPGIECPRAMEDDRCSDCAPKSPPACGKNDSGAHSSAMDDNCCSNCVPKGPSACGQGDSSAHLSVIEDNCCSGCIPSATPECGQACPAVTGAILKTEENVVDSTVTARGGETYLHCKDRCSTNTRCQSESTFGRFFDVACCCLINWRMRHPKHYRHHPGHDNHHKSHSQLGHPHSETRKQSKLKTQPPCPVPEKGNGVIVTEDAVERGGGGRIQTLLLTVQGMECSPCAQKVTRALLTLPSVQDIKVNIFKGQASLTYREGLISPSDIAKRATRLAGLTCMVDDKSQLEGKYRILRIKFSKDAGLPPESPALPLGVEIRKISRTESTVIFDVQYDAALIQPRSVLEIFASLGGSFLPPSKSESTTTSQVTGDITSRLRRTLISAILTIPVIVFSWAPLPPHPIIYGAISLFLATCIQIYVGAPLYSAAFHALFMQHVLDMDVLVTISSTIAYVFSLIAYVLQTAGHGFGTTFFETPTLLLTLITLGKLISAYSRRRATSVIDGLGTLQPDFVQMLSADGATVMVTHVDLVQPQDVLRVPSNTLIPTDGIVLRGLTQVDESALTGESIPVDKAPGTPLTAGTRNMTNSIDMKVTRAPAENTLAEFASLVARLQEARLPVQDLADRAASYLAPAILAVAVITFVIWIVIGLHIRGEHVSKGILAALRYTIAVLVVSCPCAVVLCVPMVIIITGAVAIREGVLFKTATAIQCAKNATAVVFDKTGTLTLGNMDVIEAYIIGEDAIGIILALVSQGSHPVAHTVTKYLRTTYPAISAVSLPGQVQSFPGKGLETIFDDVLVRGGSPIWLGLQTEHLYLSMTGKALTMFAVTIDAKVVGFFGLADSPRPSAPGAVEIFKRQGVPVHIVSGDAQPVVRALANRLGIPHERAVGDCLPAKKVAYVRALQGNGARVMFIGDGTNDTPALAAADISVAMSSGTDVARSAADVVFLASDLSRALGTLLRLSRGAVCRVHLNFAWAVIYNLLAVLLAAGAFVKVRIAPEYAALGEMVSVVPVVLVAWSMWFLKF